MDMAANTVVRNRYGPFGDTVSPLPTPKWGAHSLPDMNQECAGCGQDLPCPPEHTCPLCQEFPLWKGDSEECDVDIFSGSIEVGARYCSQQCSDEEFIVHFEGSCRARKTFGRACELFMELWVMYQWQTYTRPFIWLSEVTSADEPERGAINVSGNIVDDDATEWAEAAMLFDHMSVDLSETGSGLVRHFLVPYCQTLEEAYIVPKDPAVVVRWNGGQTTVREYMVFRATLSTGEQFVVDPTHAQWGWPQSVYDWDVFVKHRVSSIIGMAPLGSWRRKCLTQHLDPTAYGYDFNVTLLRKGVSDQLVAGLREWFRKYMVEVDTHPIYHTTEEWTEVTEEVCLFARVRTREINAQMAAQNLGKMHFEEPEGFWKQTGAGADELWKKATWRPNTTIRPYHAQRYTDVWFAPPSMRPEQIVLMRDAGLEAKKKLWAKRMRAAETKLEVNFALSAPDPMKKTIFS